MKHSCHIYKCNKRCHPKYLMCPEHWAKVPKQMQDDVYRTCTHKRGERPSTEYLKSARLALTFVEKESGNE